MDILHKSGKDEDNGRSKRYRTAIPASGYCAQGFRAARVQEKHGFKKTSMEDIAQASQMSRQGLYLHFRSKEDIFKAAILRAIDERSVAANKALHVKDLPLEDRLLGALDEWFGRHVGVFHPDASDILPQVKLLLGNAVADCSAAFQAQLVKAITASSSRKLKSRQFQLATDIAHILTACGITWKHELSSRDEFLERMKSAIRICCTSLN
jgi:AcrR family transcriptional regulator